MLGFFKLCKKMRSAGSIAQAPPPDAKCMCSLQFHSLLSTVKDEGEGLEGTERDFKGLLRSVKLNEAK